MSTFQRKKDNRVGNSIILKNQAFLNDHEMEAVSFLNWSQFVHVCLQVKPFVAYFIYINELFILWCSLDIIHSFIQIFIEFLLCLSNFLSTLGEMISKTNLCSRGAYILVEWEKK